MGVISTRWGRLASAGEGRYLKKRTWPNFLPIGVASVLVLIIVYPALTLLWDTFTQNNSGNPISWTLANWSRAWSEPAIFGSIQMTLIIVLATEAIALPAGVAITWLMTRTNMALRGPLEMFFWVAYFLPLVPVINGWMLLADPSFGLLNKLTGDVLGIGMPFNIYSFWGIVWIHLATKSIAAKYILLAPAFANMDSTLEEASRTCGGSTLRTLRSVVLPVMLPAIIVSLAISFVYGIESFETELLLGPPADISVYSTKLFTFANNVSVPHIADAKVLGMSVLVGMLPLIFVQQYYGRKAQVGVVTGRRKLERKDIGKLRYVFGGLILAFTVCCTILPISMLVMGTFMTLFGFFDIKDVWTASHWSSIFSDRLFVSAFKNTLTIGICVSAIGTVWYSIVAYCTVRTKSRASAVVDFLSWFPVAIPGLILGLGFVSLILDIGFLRPLYGTTYVIMLALIVASMTIGVQVLKTNLAQIHQELEEASSICGAGAIRTSIKITLPLLMPAFVTVLIITFAAAVSNVAHVALLSTGTNTSLSVLQLQYLSTAQAEAASVIGVIIVSLNLVFALTARMISRRWRLEV